MERDNKSPYSEANKNLADFSWVQPELENIYSEFLANKPKLAKLDYWNADKGFGFTYIDGDGNPSEKNKTGSKRVFVHAKNVEAYPRMMCTLNRGEKLDQVVIGSIIEDERGLSLKKGYTPEYWEKIQHDETKSLCMTVLSQIHSQNIQLWDNKITSVVKERILKMQQPHYDEQRELCPDCNREITKGYPKGMGYVRECSCGWNCFEQMVTKFGQESYPESDDGMRPAGYYGDYMHRVKEIVGKPPIIVPGHGNVAYRVTNGERGLELGKDGYFSITGNVTDPLTKIIRDIEEYARLINYFPDVPEELEPDELFEWGVESSKKITRDFSERIRGK